MQSRGRYTVLHLVISLRTGGLERFVIDLIEANKNELNQFVVCLEQAGELAGNCNVEVISLNMPPGLHVGTAWDIAKIVREKRVNIIHTHNEKAQFYGGISGLLTNVPVVHTKHGKNCLDFRTRLRNNLSARLCRKVVAVSQDAAIECTRDENIPLHKVLTILNGVDTERFSPCNNWHEAKKRLGFSDDTLVIGIVARLAPVKDHATLLEACRILTESGRDYKLLIVGDGSLRGQLEERAKAMGISNQVSFMGMREDIPDLMHAMDIFVLSSISEGISLTLLEAMACCLPVVATAVGGNPEVVVDGHTGYLVKDRSPDKLAEKLEVFLSNKQLRNTMGGAGRARVNEYFSLQKCAFEYRSLYSSIMS